LNKLNFFSLLLTSTAICSMSVAYADEGQWQPHQLPQLKAELKRVGIALPADKLADLTKAPLSAMLSLGGCSASFVSDAGLVVTNHHCAYGAIQRNSSASPTAHREAETAKAHRG